MKVRPIHKLPSVLSFYPCSRSALYRAIGVGLFPKPIALGARAVGWPESEVEAMVDARIAGKTDDEIRELVTSLEAARKDDCKEGAV